jgi:hypothetical protein
LLKFKRKILHQWTWSGGLAKQLEFAAIQMTGDHDSQDFKFLATQFIREQKYL